MKQQATITTWHTLQIMHTPPPPALHALPRKTFVPLIVPCGFPYRGGVEAPVAIVHHCDSHRNLAWRPIPQPRQTGSPEGGCYRAVEVLRKSTRGIMGRESAALPKRPRTAHRTARTGCRTSPYGRWGGAFCSPRPSIRPLALYAQCPPGAWGAKTVCSGSSGSSAPPWTLTPPWLSQALKKSAAGPPSDLCHLSMANLPTLFPGHKTLGQALLQPLPAPV